MGKVLRFNESDFIELCKLIVEEVDLDKYDDTDLIDAFLTVFKDWITKKLGDEVKKYPLSFLLRKYGYQFEKEILPRNNDDETDNDYEEDEDINNRDYDRWRLNRVARDLIKSGIVTLPNLNTDVKFTEKYKKQIPFIKSQIDLPEYVDLVFSEEQPNKVDAQLNVDFQKYITDKGIRPLSKWDVEKQIKDFLSGFMGVQFGNPVYGGVEFNMDDFHFENMEEWVKNVLNKKLKKEIRQLPGSGILHSIRFKPDNYGKFELKLVFKDSYSWSRSYWQEKSEFKDAVKTYFENLGYNPYIFKIDW